MCLVVLVSFIYIIFFSDDCKYCCIGTGIKYLFIIYLLIIKSELISVRSKWNWQKNYTDIAYKIYFKFFKAEKSS
jgi:hypothetical protein